MLTTLILIIISAFAGVLGYLVLDVFNITLSFFAYKTSFVKALKQNRKFFLLYSLIFGVGIPLITIFFMGFKLSILLILAYMVYGIVFTLFVFLALSVWIYFSYKVLKNDYKVFWSVVVFFILLGLIFSLITGKF